MARDIKQLTSEFDSSIKKAGNDPFEVSDYVQIKDMVMEILKESDSMRSPNALLFHSADIALRAGYMIGLARASEG